METSRGNQIIFLEDVEEQGRLGQELQEKNTKWLDSSLTHFRQEMKDTVDKILKQNEEEIQKNKSIFSKIFKIK